MTKKDLFATYEIVKAIAYTLATIHQNIGFEKDYKFEEDILWQWRARLQNWTTSFEQTYNINHNDD